MSSSVRKHIGNSTAVPPSSAPDPHQHNGAGSELERGRAGTHPASASRFFPGPHAFQLPARISSFSERASAGGTTGEFALGTERRVHLAQVTVAAYRGLGHDLRGYGGGLDDGHPAPASMPANAPPFRPESDHACQWLLTALARGGDGQIRISPAALLSTANWH